MKDNNYRNIGLLTLGLMRVRLWWLEFQIENQHRLIARIKDEVARDVAEYDELYYYQRELLAMMNKANEIRNALALHEWWSD